MLSHALSHKRKLMKTEEDRQIFVALASGDQIDVSSLLRRPAVGSKQALKSDRIKQKPRPKPWFLWWTIQDSNL